MNGRAKATHGARRGAFALSLLLAIAASGATGQVYKCTDGDGRTVYADTPCGGASTKLRMPADDARQAGAGPVVCAQLQDEIQRLGAQADRDAARGRKPNAADAARRQSLGKQYAARCVGIARSESKSR